MAKKKNTTLTSAQLEALKEMLLERRGLMATDANSIEQEALNKGAGKASGELSSVPFHMADVGSENYEREFMLGILESEGAELRLIDDALRRIERGEYGMCQSEDCDKSISLARLKALPHARYCIECQKKRETGRS